MKRLNVEELRARLREACEPTQDAWSKKHGISKSHVSQVLNGRQDFGPTILRAMGYRKVILYEPIEEKAA